MLNVCGFGRVVERAVGERERERGERERDVCVRVLGKVDVQL